MARKIGEGFVRLRPDVDGPAFEAEARRELDGPLARLNERLRQRISSSRLGAALSRAVGRGADEASPAVARAGGLAGRRFGDGFAGTARRRLRGLLPGLIRVVAVGAVVAVLGSLVAHAVAVTSAILPMIGALAAVPGVAFAAAAGLGALLLAAGGLGEAWKAAGQASAGGAAAAQVAASRVSSAQRQVEVAQRSLADAQRDARRVQEELTDARRDAAARLEDLSRALAGARLDEEAAVLAVARAQQRLEVARGDPHATAMDVAEADLAWRQSVQTLAEVRDRVADLATEQDEAARAGVDGSDRVRAALRGQADAARAVEDAQRQLAEAQQQLSTAGAATAAGADKAAQALGRLAPAARRLVVTGRELAQVWRDRVQQSVQQATFAGVAADLRLVSDALLPTMSRRLVRLGGTWNETIRATLGLARSREFVADLDDTLARSTIGARLLGRSWVPVISGLRHIGVVGGEFLPRLGGWVLRISQRFDRWAEAARRSGRMHGWIDRAGQVMAQLWRIAVNVGGAVRALFAAGDDGGKTLDSIERVTGNMRDWLASAEGQAKVSAFFAGLRSVLASVVQVVPQLVAAVLQLGPALQRVGEQDALGDTLSVGAVLMGFLADNIDKVTTVLPYLVTGFVAFRTAQAAANVAQAVSPVLATAQVVANVRLAASQRALVAQLAASRAALVGQTAAQGASTVAANTGATAARRSIVAMAAQKVAMVATRAATIAWTVVQWALNAALVANPVGLIVVAIAALVAGIVVAYQRSETFRKIVQGALKAVVGAARGLWSFWGGTLWPGIRRVFDLWTSAQQRVFGFILDLPGKVRSKMSGVGDTFFAPFKWAFNKIASGWNSTAGKLKFTAPAWIPGFGGKGWAMPTIPTLAAGGVLRARRGGTLFLGGEGGEDEAVAPLSTLAGMIKTALVEALRGAGRGTHIENLNVSALSPFSLPQVLDEAAWAGGM